MRICYIANSASSHTAKWATYFSNLGHEVHIVSHSNVQIPGTTVHYLDYSLRNFPFMVGKVHRLIRQLKPDIVHAQQANTCGLYAVTMRDYKVVVSAWGSDILVEPGMSPILKKIIQYVVRNAYILTSDSEYMSREIVNLGGKKESIYTFPMGVEEELTKYRREFSDNDGEIRFISTRRLEDLYKVDVIIDGFYNVIRRNPHAHLTIAADGSEMDKLKSMVKGYGIEDKVNFTGRYRPEDIGKMLQDNDVFVSIPDSDSTSVSLLEGMCCGLFPIVSDLPANREWVKHLDNGYIIPAIDGAHVADAMSWCLNNKAHLKEASEKNRGIILERALWKNNAKIVEKIYDELARYAH